MSEYNQIVQSGLRTLGKRIRKGFLWILLIGAIGGAIYLGICNWTYSKGQRSGILNKISYKGVVWKTYEGELNMGNFEEGMPGSNWAFSVWKDEIYHELQEHQGHQVKLYYREKLKAMPWQGKTNYFVYKVELIRKAEDLRQSPPQNGN